MRIAALLAFALLAPAASAHGHAPVAAESASAPAPLVAVADRLGAALKAGDFTTVATLLDPQVQVLESGGAEHSRAQYLAEHAIADAAFLREANVRIRHRSGAVQGAMGWLATESEVSVPTAAGPRISLATETLVFARRGGQWRIVHVHWSSHPRSAAP